MMQTTQPIVSIVVPIYNVEPYVNECLASILGQTYRNLQVLVVEDCSTDGSLNAMAPHLADPRVRLIRHYENQGLSAARNTGIDAACGEYLMFVDSDDVIDSTLVEVLVQTAGQAIADVILCGFTPFKDGEAVPASLTRTHGGCFEKIEGKAYFSYPHFAWLKFMRRELLQNPALRFPVGRYYEDWPFHWELGFNGVKIVRLFHNGYFYRQRKGSITASGDRKMFHTFSAHMLLVDIVDRNAASDPLRRLLTDRVHHGTWFVLRTIDVAYLREAVSLAKAHLRDTRELREGASGDIRSMTLRAMLSLPQPLATISIRVLRAVLGLLSQIMDKAGPQNDLHSNGTD